MYFNEQLLKEYRHFQTKKGNLILIYTFGIHIFSRA